MADVRAAGRRWEHADVTYRWIERTTDLEALVAFLKTLTEESLRPAASLNSEPQLELPQKSAKGTR